MTTNKTYINARPSALPNIGAEVLGAHRHNRDTYDNPAEREDKERVKRASNSRKALKAEYSAKFDAALSDETRRDIIRAYLFDLFRASAPQFAAVQTLADARTAYNQLPEGITLEERKALRSLYNRTARAMSRASCLYGDRLVNYFTPKTKNTFSEKTGVNHAWGTDQTPTATDMATIERLSRGVQFGNALPDSARAYCLINLSLSLSAVASILPGFPLQSLAFAFAARGTAKGVAHYEPSANICQFNRDNIGSFIHELGHAIDYHLESVSHTIPATIRKCYEQKAFALTGGGPQYHYLCRSTEIFARMFEAMAPELFGPSLSRWMIDGRTNDHPDMDAETTAWFMNAIKPLLNN